MDNLERLQRILTIAKGAERLVEIGGDKMILLALLRGITLMVQSSDEYLASNKAEFDRIEALARKYERY